MTDPLSERAARNLRAWAEITELCLALRRAVLAQSVPIEEVEGRLFAEIRERKERAWRATPI